MHNISSERPIQMKKEKKTLILCEAMNENVHEYRIIERKSEKYYNIVAI